MLPWDLDFRKDFIFLSLTLTWRPTVKTTSILDNKENQKMFRNMWKSSFRKHSSNYEEDQTH